jgi:chromate transport protein ChrA
MLVVILPILVIMFCTINNIQFPYIGFYLAISQAWISAIKPVATILIVENYRRAALRVLLCGKKTTMTGSVAETTGYPTTFQPTIFVHA